MRKYFVFAFIFIPKLILGQPTEYSNLTYLDLGFESIRKDYIIRAYLFPSDKIVKTNDSIYILDKRNFTLLKEGLLLTENLIELNRLYEIQIANNNDLVKEYTKIIKVENERNAIYKDAYFDQKNVVDEMSLKFDELNSLYKEDRKRSSINNFLYGSLGGITLGVIIGVIITK